MAAVTETLAAQALCEAVVRITALRGVGPPGPDPTQCGAAILFITAREYAGYPDRLYQEGARAIVATSRQNEFSPLCRVKRHWRPGTPVPTGRLCPSRARRSPDRQCGV